jgi:hypothetical protein
MPSAAKASQCLGPLASILYTAKRKGLRATRNPSLT